MQLILLRWIKNIRFKGSMLQFNAIQKISLFDTSKLHKAISLLLPLLVLCVKGNIW
jgi:hypothetical protein